MFQLRFNQVFFGLMGVSFITAFLAPPRLTDLGRVQLEGLFIPVSRPAYYIANRLRGKFVHDQPEDARPSEQIRQENLQLRQEVTRLQMEVERLQGLASERQNLGDVQSLCEHFTVAATDSGNRDALILEGSTTSIKTEQPVLYGGGLAGKIDRVGVGSAHVRLLTDTGFTVSGRFIRFTKTDAGIQAEHISELLPIIQGIGAGQMVIANLPLQDVTDAKLQPNDWLVLSDNTWPAAIQGIRVGRIASIQRSRRAALFAEIHLAPETGLIRLNDVWVMTKQP